MQPVHTEDCNIVYKGPREDIGDLWCHRVRPGQIRITYEFTDEERAQLAEGARLQLYVLTEPIPPVALGLIDKADSEPVGPHGWKINKNPGDKLRKEESGGESNGKSDGEEEEPSVQGADSVQAQGKEADPIPARAQHDGSTGVGQ